MSYKIIKHTGIPLSLIVTVLFCLSSILCRPEKACAIGETHLYVFPGAWSQDIPTGWVTQLHLRYSCFDKVFDNHGDAFDPGFKVNSFQWFGKLIHVQRLSEEWQLTNVLIYTLLANAEMDGSSGGSDFHKSVTGPGDINLTNFIGRWWKNRMIHTAVGCNLKLPTGDFEEDRALNIGENRFIFNGPNFFFQFRYPLEKGALWLEYAIDFDWKFKNLDTHYDDHDTCEMNAVLTYFTSRECTFGFFVQPDLVFALNNSKIRGTSMHDDNYYTFGTGLGFVWNIKPGRNVNLKWEHDWFGRGLNYGTYAPKIDAAHFMVTYAF